MVEYSAENSQALSSALEGVSVGRLLKHSGFLKHFYLDHPTSRLYLLLDDDGDIVATLGSEKVPVRIGTGDIKWPWALTIIL